METKTIIHNLENDCSQFDVLPFGLYLFIYFFLVFIPI